MGATIKILPSYLSNQKEENQDTGACCKADRLSSRAVPLKFILSLFPIDGHALLLGDSKNFCKGRLGFRQPSTPADFCKKHARPHHPGRHAGGTTFGVIGKHQISEP